MTSLWCVWYEAPGIYEGVNNSAVSSIEGFDSRLCCPGVCDVGSNTLRRRIVRLANAVEHRRECGAHRRETLSRQRRVILLPGVAQWGVAVTDMRAIGLRRMAEAAATTEYEIVTAEVEAPCGPGIERQQPAIVPRREGDPLQNRGARAPTRWERFKGCAALHEDIGIRLGKHTHERKKYALATTHMNPVVMHKRNPHCLQLVTHSVAPSRWRFHWPQTCSLVTAREMLSIRAIAAHDNRRRS